MRYLCMALLLVLGSGAWAQRTEVNPNIKWAIVHYQDMDLQSGRMYSFEFPGEPGYDYVATITHDRADLVVNIGVFDLQHAEQRQKLDSTGNASVDLNFRLSDSGTFRMVYSLASDQLDATLPAKVAIVRRPIVPD